MADTTLSTILEASMTADDLAWLFLIGVLAAIALAVWAALTGRLGNG